MSDYNEPSWLSKEKDAPASPLKAKLAAKPSTPNRPAAEAPPANSATSNGECVHTLDIVRVHKHWQTWNVHLY